MHATVSGNNLIFLSKIFHLSYRYSAEDIELSIYYIRDACNIFSNDLIFFWQNLSQLLVLRRLAKLIYRHFSMVKLT